MLVLAAAGPAAADPRSGPIELGAAINDAGFAFGGQEYRDTFLEHHDAATAESAMKMMALQPERGEYEFARADAIVDWARGAQKKVHGHVLVWCADEWNPSWVTGRSWTREELLAVMEDHIRTVMDHFEGRVDTWDVVNEALVESGDRRDCVWQRHIGDDWVAQAFRIAREADPQARLFYNEWLAEVPKAKYEAMLRLLEGVDLDGVGLQNHTYGYAPLQYEVEDAIARLGARGLDVHVSELNVTTSQIGGNLAQQAQAYWTIAAACQAQPACFRITTWGFTDAYGWRPPSEKALPFDVEYEPKPAWHAIRRAIGRLSGPRPPMPVAPRLRAPVTQGDVEVSWTQVPDATYTLQHRDARGEWRTLASGLWWNAFSLVEREGTWEYRVRAEDGPWSEPSGAAKVDRTPPAPPFVAPSVAWFPDRAVAGFAAHDPPLPDGSPGSGVEPTPPQLYAMPGVLPLRGVTVTDRAGNVSPPADLELRIDAEPPQVALMCPGRIVRGDGSTGRYVASDAHSGLASSATGTVPLPSPATGTIPLPSPATGTVPLPSPATGTVPLPSPATGTVPLPSPATGTVPGGVAGVARVTVRDAVGHEARAQCSYRVLAPLRLHAARVRAGVARLVLGCRLARCRSMLTLRTASGRLAGRSRTARTILRGRPRTAVVPLRRTGRLTVFAGLDRLGVVRARG